MRRLSKELLERLWTQTCEGRGETVLESMGLNECMERQSDVLQTDRWERCWSNQVKTFIGRYVGGAVSWQISKATR